MEIVKDLYSNIDNYTDKEIVIEGWVRTIRNSKTFGFIELNDGTFFKNIQIVFDDKLTNYADICKLTISSSIKVMGTFIKTEGARQPFEIRAKKVEIEHLADLDYPLQKKHHSFEYLRTVSHLRPRTNTFNAVFRVRSVLSYAIHKFFRRKEFCICSYPYNYF